MLCTGKSGSSNNWLDKLRSSKGFPDGNGHDLEHFLNPNPNSDYDVNLEKNDPKSSSDLVVLEEKGVAFRSVTNSKPHHQQSSTMEKEDLFDIMSSVLAELFNMGGDSEKVRGFDKKKSSRKQSNPRICVTSGSASVDDCCLNEARKSAMSPSSADNSVIEEKRIGDQNRMKMMKKQGSIVVAAADVIPLSVEDEKMKVDYSGYSRADVMVIDTSASVWKSEKIVFRKGSVWKVRDKKSKCRRVFGTRKRKSNQSDDSEGGGNKKKKKKKKQKLALIPSSTIKEVVHEKCLMLSNERCPLDSAVGATFNPNNVLELRQAQVFQIGQETVQVWFFCFPCSRCSYEQEKWCATPKKLSLSYDDKRLWLYGRQLSACFDVAKQAASRKQQSSIAAIRAMGTIVRCGKSTQEILGGSRISRSFL